jgi:hypothetical protein
MRSVVTQSVRNDLAVALSRASPTPLVLRSPCHLYPPAWLSPALRVQYIDKVPLPRGIIKGKKPFLVRRDSSAFQAMGPGWEGRGGAGRGGGVGSAPGPVSTLSTQCRGVPFPALVCPCSLRQTAPAKSGQLGATFGEGYRKFDRIFEVWVLVCWCDCVLVYVRACGN